MQWPGQTTPATPMQWSGARPTTTVPLGGVPETVAPTAPERSPWGDTADGGSDVLLWGALGVGALVAVVAWQMRSRQQERGRAATRLRAEEMRQDAYASGLRLVGVGEQSATYMVLPGAHYTGIPWELKARHAAGWNALPEDVETVPDGKDHYRLQVKPQADE
jgi:hypothetical protein